MYLGRMSFPLVLLLYRRFAGNEHLRPRLIPASSKTVVTPYSGLDGPSYVITTTTTNSQTSANTNANFPRRLLFLSYAMGFRIWDCTNLSAVSEVLSLSAWSAAATSLSSSAGVGIGIGTESGVGMGQRGVGGN